MNCFDRWLPSLSTEFSNRVTKGMSEDEQREVAKNIALEYHKQLHDELNGVKGKLGLKKESYVNPNNAEKVKEINDHYDKLINEIKSQSNAVPKQEAGEMGVRNETTIRPEVGSNDQSGKSTGEGNGQPPEETGKATGEEENKRVSGIAQRVQESLGLRKYEKGKGWSKEEAFAFGKAALAHGVDPMKAVTDPNYENLGLSERLAIAQAHDNDLNKAVIDAEDKNGIDSPEYKEAVKNLDDFAKAYQPLKTEFSKAGMAQQGAIEIDTGNFTSVKKAAEENLGKPLDEKQTQKVKELTTTNKKLKATVDKAESDLTKATDAVLGKEKGKPTRTRLSTQLNDIAKRIRTSSEFDEFLKGASGVQKMGVDLPRLKEIAASVLEDASKAVKAGENAIDFIREAVSKLKDDIDKDKLTEALTSIGEKQGLFDVKEEQLGQQRSKMKKPLTEHEQIEKDENDVQSLQKELINQKGNQFTPKEASGIWKYMKEKYLDKNVNYRDAISQVSDDLGLSFKQVSNAIVTPKTKPLSDAMWKAQFDARKNREATQRYVDGQGENPAIKGFKKFINAFREETVFGHGGVFVGTHAGMTLMDLPRAKYTFKALVQAYKLAYGKDAYYEKAMTELKESPNYELAQRSGMKNNPDVINNDAEIIAPLFGKFSESGKRGFNAIKILRQALFDSHYDALSKAEKADPGSAVSIAKLVNNATGASNLDLPKWVNDVTFAGGMEAARWGKLTRNPMRAASTALQALFKPESASIEDRVFAKVWAKRVGTELASYAGLLTLNAAIQNSLTDDKGKKVNLLDPTQSDWMKMKMGGVVFDFTSGMLSTTHFISSILHQSVTGKPDDKREGLSTSLAKTAYKYGTGKLSPFYGDVAEAATRHDYNGNTLPWSDAKPLHSFNHKMTWEEYGESKLPLPVAEGFKTFYEQAHQQGLSKDKLNNILTGLMFTGISGSTGFKAYESHEQTPTKKELKALADKKTRDENQ